MIQAEEEINPTNRHTHSFVFKHISQLDEGGALCFDEISLRGKSRHQTKFQSIKINSRINIRRAIQLHYGTSLVIKTLKVVAYLGVPFQSMLGNAGMGM